MYCIFCGEKNEKEKKCKKCGRKLNPKSHLFQNYVIEKCEGNIDDSIFKHLLNFLKTKLYGIILTVSVVATSTIVVTNIVSNQYITELKEEPTFHYAAKSYSYLGTGLSQDEIIDYYIEAVKKGDLESANGYLAKNFLTEEQMNLIPLERARPKFYMKIKHDFVENNHKFFDHMDSILVDKNNFVGRFDYLDVEPLTIHNNRFDIESHYLELTYCLENNCSTDTQFKLMEVLETIEMDGNAYILSEYAFLTDHYSRVVRYIFDQHHGDLKDVDNEEFYHIIDSCLDEEGLVICDLPLPEYGEE